jgi:hypothetical protein
MCPVKAASALWAVGGLAGLRSRGLTWRNPRVEKVLASTAPIGVVRPGAK